MSDELTSLFEFSENPAKPFLHEVLKRDADYDSALQAWIFSDRYADIKQLLHQYYVLHDDTGINHTFERRQNNASNNIRITFTPAYFEKNELQLIADAWKHELLQHNYKKYVSDVRHFLRNDYVEIIERHYLKPKINLDNIILEQQFGNIIIEFRMIDEKSFDLQLQVHYYSGRNYSEAFPFDDLLSILFK
ncbi:MAG: hypothetical protein IPG60_01255 [Bacteroidetes bacterium]|nr:hypothetical protein [Bacteroidota bacterium]MBP8754163.1 hypothetical protein [Chitinophagales bacterium]MBP9189587.1 hypothetical protein [Chitinophagales bacterium]MBP9549032.1 hypothetical protein [Chitinophagales bacterium]MBP9704948.1 hypothetical protein [Chitinophagales bacterium]